MFFKEISGHKEIKRKLLITVKEERISHAQLFTGPQGNGKLAMAIAYAQYVSCTDKQENDSCGKCSSCIKYNKLIHPDLHFVFPVVSYKGNSKPVSDDFLKQWREFILEKSYHSFNDWLEKMGVEKKQAGIFAHESNEIIRKLNLKTFESDYKVMIIWMPERMNISAANKVLKVIEEPPEKTLFILVSDNTEMIIRTILSRTQLIKIPKISREDMYETIKGEYEIPEEKIQEIVRLSSGSFLKALKLLNSDEVGDSEYFTKFTELMRYSYSVKIDKLLLWAEGMSGFGREKQKIFIKYSLRMLRENFILNISSENKNKISFLADKELNFSEKFSTFIHKNNIYKLNEEFNLALKHIERNGYDRLIMLDLALKTTKLLKIKNDI